MKAVNGYCNSQEKPSYEELLQLAKHGRELRSKAIADFFAVIFRKTGAFIKRTLHMDVNDKYSAHTGA